MRPVDVLDLRSELIAWHAKPHALQVFEGHWGEEEIMSQHYSASGLTPRQFVLAQQAMLRSSSAFMVDKAMTPLCKHAAATLPDIRGFTESELPSVAGFLIWDGEPAWSRTLDTGERQDIIAVSWVCIGNNINISIFEDREGGTYPGPDPEAERDAARVLYPRLVDLGRMMLRVGDPDVVMNETWAGPLARVLISTWMLMRQTLTQTSRCDVPRGTRRRAERLGELSEISVVRLRRIVTRNDNDDPQPVEWSHRWIVSGHWRNQWVPSLEAHRPTWIAPYVKGPEDLPLVVKDRVSVLSR